MFPKKTEVITLFQRSLSQESRVKKSRKKEVRRERLFAVTQRFAPILPRFLREAVFPTGVLMHCVIGTARLIRVDSQLYEQMETFFSSPSRS